MTRGGAAKAKDGPERRCIVTGEVQPKAGLIRFVVAPDGQIVPDLLGKLPGRGIWVSADRDALQTAMKKRLFARAARQQVAVAEDLLQVLEAGLLRRVTEGLALARKAGQAVAGYEKVKAWLDTGQAAVLIQAHDGSARGKSKLKPPRRNDGYIGCLSSSELGLAFGRESVIHGALATGGLTERVVEDAAKLSGVRKKIGEDVPGKG
ncbi:putative nucleic-acid-binding protein implicated in transcription termination [Rhodovulum sp. P5]|uniref:RNA-binding protein n=1 Tax=Rhodovulum sp. P5 TaxID=1564506 RepID=UPI0009C39149|nr:RNA-binding protein [Rhodovulum sp. P5]ARE40659.1 putative nucleic-acid-binding protein implicated in transcription termination [Rhodovulum sp. P5]